MQKKIKKIHRVDPEKNASQTDGQADRQINKIDFIGPLPQRRAIWLDCKS